VSAIVRSSEEPFGRRRDALRVLRAAPGAMSITAIADELGVHPNTVRFHLETLVSDGRVEHVEPDRRQPGRPPLMFRAVRQMDRGGARRYRVLAEILINGLTVERNPGDKALEAGRAWGRQLESPAHRAKGLGAEESIDRLVDVLDELGFAPERRESDGEQQVGLRHCPFLEVAETRTSVVCPIHLGLMQGALERWEAPLAVDRLDPLVEPDLCLARLSRDGTAR
jgi:predicted ArsR family transcriptional regulator